MTALKIAVFGGTFNPIHLGHLRVVENAIRTLGLHKVYWVPCSSPPHKEETGLAPARHRLAMVKRGIEGNPQLEALAFEIERGGASYSIDTIRHVRADHPRDTLFFIVGSDNFRDVGRWHRFAEIAVLCEFLVLERPGSPLELPPPSIPRDQLGGLRYRALEGGALSISSSEIRQCLREGKNVSHWLPPAVYDYIREHRLYQTPA